MGYSLPLINVLIDDQLNWSKHVVKKGFVKMLNLLKRSKLVPMNMLLDLYFRVINAVDHIWYISMGRPHK